MVMTTSVILVHTRYRFLILISSDCCSSYFVYFGIFTVNILHRAVYVCDFRADIHVSAAIFAVLVLLVSISFHSSSLIVVMFLPFHRVNDFDNDLTIVFLVVASLLLSLFLLFYNIIVSLIVAAIS